MKRVISLTLSAAILLTVTLLCVGCAHPNVTNETAPPTTEPTIPAPTVNYHHYTDEELLREACESGCFDDWGFSSDARTYSIAGLVEWSNRSPALWELLGRQSAIQSLRKYGPILAEEYWNAEGFTLHHAAYALVHIVGMLEGEPETEPPTEIPAKAPTVPQG